MPSAPCEQCGRRRCRSQLHCVRVAMHRLLKEAGFVRLCNGHLGRAAKKLGLPAFDAITLDRSRCYYVPAWMLEEILRAHPLTWTTRRSLGPPERFFQHPDFRRADPALVARIGDLYTMLHLAGWCLRGSTWQRARG